MGYSSVFKNCSYQKYPIFFRVPTAYFFAMNRSVEYQSPRAPVLKGSEEKPVYILSVVLLLVLWAVFIAVTALVAVALFVPGHFGLSDWLRLLMDSPVFST
jgi:hypothetical protein